MSTHIVIPARYHSTRLPQKVLADVGGAPMVVRSYRQALQVSGVDDVLVAADHDDIIAACQAHDARVCKTNVNHPSGSSRLAEVVDREKWADSDVVVCLQADEPLLPPTVVSDLIQHLRGQSSAQMASVYEPIHTMEELMDPSVVKVVLNHKSEAMYFSRAPIPWHRDAFANEMPNDCPTQYYRHVGLYAYRVSFLKRYFAWDASELELTESLEQLRVLYHGESILMVQASEHVPAGIDTPEDLVRVRSLF